MARAVWGEMASDQNIKPGVVSGELATLSTTSGRSLGVESQINSFVNAKTASEKAGIGVDLLGEVADASALTLDPSTDSYPRAGNFCSRTCQGSNLLS